MPRPSRVGAKLRRSPRPISTPTAPIGPDSAGCPASGENDGFVNRNLSVNSL